MAFVTNNEIAWELPREVESMILANGYSLWCNLVFIDRFNLPYRKWRRDKFGIYRKVNHKDKVELYD